MLELSHLQSSLHVNAERLNQQHNGKEKLIPYEQMQAFEWHPILVGVNVLLRKYYRSSSKK